MAHRPAASKSKKTGSSSDSASPDLTGAADLVDVWIDDAFSHLEDAELALSEPLEPGPLPGTLADPGSQSDIAFDFDDRVRLLPERPGCYLMRDRQGVIVYIGKAANLRARLRQYASGQDERFFVQWLRQVLGDLEVIVTASEKDALLLENELIKRHQPRFNVKLKDDKRFIHLRLAQDESFPRLQVVRRPARDKALYFGPYASASAARATLAQINRWFQLRTCPDAVFRNRTRPCLEYQIQRCPGPCVLPVDPADYAVHVRDVSLFLSGRRGELLGRLKQQMQEAAADEAFERAARYRDRLQAVEASLETQRISQPGQTQALDALGIYREGARVCLAILSFREGVLLGSQGHVLKDQEWADHEVLSGFISQIYDRGQPVPDELLLPSELPDQDVLADWLTDLRKQRAQLQATPCVRGKVELVVPQRGWKAQLLTMAQENARQTFEDRLRQGQDAQRTLEGLQKRLHLQRLPRRIECYDISNISGTEPVGSMVVFTDGVADKAEYRRFKVRTLDTPNDFAMMYEVLSRRFQRLQDGQGRAPDLVVIDGGKGQLKMAQEALQDLGMGGVDLCGLAKSRTLAGSDLGPSQFSPERVFRPAFKNPIVMPQNSNEIYLLTRIRDEAHRFAITFHRQLRQVRVMRSLLDRVPGVGTERKKSLLQAFGSLKGVKAATHAQLAQVPGVGQDLARRIRLVLAPKATEPGDGKASGDDGSS